MAKHSELPDVAAGRQISRATRRLLQIFTLAFGATEDGAVRSRPRPAFRPSGSQRCGRPSTPPCAIRASRTDAKRNGLEAEGRSQAPEVDDVLLRDIYATPKAIVQRYEAIRNER
jgi:hypothetical protein